MIHLRNERLSVAITEPGVGYRDARFDWSGFITQVTLDDEYSFCAPESLEEGEGSGGIGLCNEFGIFRPIGYDDARIGEQFPKLGVGLLQKIDDEVYDFTRDYPVAPFPIHWQIQPDCVEFTIEPLPCRGYEARLKKIISLHDNDLRIEYELENVGEKPLRTHEYGHNFVAVNGGAPGPDYSLQLQPGVLLRKMPPALFQEASTIHWSAPLAAPLMVRSANFASGECDSMSWELTHAPSGCGLREKIEGRILRFALWCAPHVISPEVFIDINLQPGEKQRWTRRTTFFKLPTRPIVRPKSHKHL